MCINYIILVYNAASLDIAFPNFETAHFFPFEVSKYILVHLDYDFLLKTPGSHYLVAQVSRRRRTGTSSLPLRNPKDCNKNNFRKVNGKVGICLAGAGSNGITYQTTRRHILKDGSLDTNSIKYEASRTARLQDL